MKGMPNGIVEDIMCMDSINEGNGFQERHAVDVTKIIWSANDERTKNYEANAEEDTLSPAKAHEEGIHYEEVGRNGAGSSVE